MFKKYLNEITPSNIIFTSLYDDCYGGDFNGDGNATTPDKGAWKYIHLDGYNNTSQGIGNMNYCKLLYAGFNTGAVYFRRSDRGYFTNGLLQYSAYRDLRAEYDTLTTTNNSFPDCYDLGVYAQGAVLELDNCDFNFLI